MPSSKEYNKSDSFINIILIFLIVFNQHQYTKSYIVFLKHLYILGKVFNATVL